MSGLFSSSSALAVALMLWLVPVGSAGAAVVYSYQATLQWSHVTQEVGASSRASPAPASTVSPSSPAHRAVRAPSEAPLTSAISDRGSEDTAGVPSGKGDQLIENGLSSPLCQNSMSAGLSSAALRNCQTSGFVGAPAPTNDYNLDVNINLGAFGFSRGSLLSVIQDVFIAPVWGGLVWGVHALLVMLQWCYALELLGGSTMSGVASSLREAQASFTQPWLALVLSAASVLALYNGLVRRRVTETLGHALLTGAMMAVGLWVIADPLGTVGAVGRWANQASLGTLGAAVHGTAADGAGTLGDSMRAVFASAIELPWCYLEFGNVRWCSEPASLDPRLRKAALSMVASQRAKLDCRPSLARAQCQPREEASALSVERTGTLVREADTNGALFLAFPANGPERNSVKSKSSLLHVLCQGEDDTNCQGPTAAQAEFRSGSGTFPRMIGVLLIAIGALGMTMLFGLVAVHLLASAVLSLFILLLAPFAVLAPALGDGGRTLFTGWLTRLLGAVSSKLIFSFLLGALLTMQRVLTSLQALGWWTQWLLISAFWWTVFLKRHQAIAFVRNRGRGPIGPSRGTAPQRVKAVGHAKAAMRPMRWARAKFLAPAPANEQLQKREHGGRGAQSKRADKQAGGGPKRTKQRPPTGVVGPIAPAGRAREPDAKSGEPTHDRAAPTDGAPEYSSARVSSARVSLQAQPTVAEQRHQARKPAALEQLERVRRGRAAALVDGDRRRVLRLGVREQRIEAQLARERGPQGQLSALGTRVESGHRARNSAAARSPVKARPHFPSPTTQPLSNSRANEPSGARERRPSIMDDAREVAAGRKRQLGFEPPPGFRHNP